MKLGINSYSFMWAIGFTGAQPEAPLTALGLLEKARWLGVKVVQVGPNLPLLDLPTTELESFIRTARERGLTLELGTRGLETELLEAQIALCGRLGSRLLRTVPELDGIKASPEALTDQLRRLRPRLEAAGLWLALENGNLPAADLRQAIDAAGSPNVGVVLDLANSLAIPEGWQEVTRLLAPYTMCLHYKDFAVKRCRSQMGFSCEGRPAGRGQIDPAWLFRALQASRYDFNVILELWPPEQTSLAETIALESDWAIESIAYLRDWVKG